MCIAPARARGRAALRLLSAAMLLAGSAAPAADISFRAAASATLQAAQPVWSGSCTSNNGNGGGSSLDLSTASGTCSGNIADGHVLIAHVAVRGTPTITAPAGWTLIATQAGGTAITQAVYWRAATTAATSGTWTFSTSQRAAGGITSFKHVDAVSPVGAAGGQGSAGSNTATAPGQSQSVANALVLALFSAARADVTIGTATGMTEAYETSVASTSNGLRLALDHVFSANPGVTGNKTASLSASIANVGQLLVLKPGGRLTVPVPTGTAAGDVMVATLAFRDSAVGAAAPAGWTLVNQVTQPTSGSNGLKLATYWRAVTGTEPASYSWGFSGGVFEFAAAGISSFIGVDTSAPVNAQAGRAAGDGVSHNVSTPSITPTVNGAMLVGGFTFLNADAWTPPTGFTEVVDVRTPSGGAAVGLMLEQAYRRQTTAAAVSATAIVSPTYSADYGAAHLLALKPVPAAVDHYEVSLPSASLACLPSTVTVTACADASSPCTNPATAANGATATLTASGGTLAATSLSFNAGGVATSTLVYPTAGNGAVATVSLSGESLPGTGLRRCCPDGSSCVAANSCSTTFSSAGFVIAATAGGAATTLPTQTAGTTSGNFVLRAVKTGTSTAACEAAITSPTAVDWAYECNDPAACSGSNLLRIASTPVQRNNDGGVAGYTAVTMNFDASGNAPFNFRFDDVGLATLWVRKTVGGALLQGHSNAFVSRPAGFTVTGLAQTAAPNTANPAATGATGGRFVQAGEAFTATVTATTSSGAAAPNFGRESSPEGVSLSPVLVLPAGGSSGVLSNAVIAGASFTNGVATVNNLAFSEVGIVTLTPALADGNYLGTGAVAGTPTGNVGRFVPARFALSAPTLTHRAARACSPASAYTYLDENFRLTVTLTAQNTAGLTTANYSGAFARFDATNASAWGLAGIAGSTVFSGASGRLSLGSAAGSWNGGVLAGATLNAAALRGSAPDGPFDAVFGVAPVDPDGVALASLDLDTDLPANGADRATVATAALRFGRLRLVNAIGAADRSLVLPLQAETWNGSGFVLNTLDNCSTVPAAAVNLGRRRGSLTAADVTAAGPVTLAGGAGRLQLTAPGGGRSGTLDVALSLGATLTDAACLGPWTPTPAATAGAGLAALRSNWCSSAYAHDPAARATFGRQRTSGSTVYRRENF